MRQENIFSPEQASSEHANMCPRRRAQHRLLSAADNYRELISNWKTSTNLRHILVIVYQKWQTFSKHLKLSCSAYGAILRTNVCVLQEVVLNRLLIFGLSKQTNYEGQSSFLHAGRHAAIIIRCFFIVCPRQQALSPISHKS